MEKKFELTNKTKKLFSQTLHQIKALKSFNDVNKGDLGGWIETENNFLLPGRQLMDNLA